MEPERVHRFYQEMGGELFSNLKLIVILREPVSRELSLYNHKKREFLQTHEENSWFSDVAANGTLLSFDQFAVNVLQDRIASSWRMIGKYVDYLRRWVSLFNRKQLLVLSYDELQDDPDRAQWRIRQFLGRDFPGELPRLNTKGKAKETNSPRLANQVLEPIFDVKNQELYQFLEVYPGPW